jgi:ferritin-like metal-binding protein YciE
VNTPTLQDLYVERLETLLTDERTMGHALTRLRETARSPLLMAALARMAADSSHQIERLETVLASSRMDSAPDNGSSRGFRALLSEATTLATATMDARARDVLLIVLLQRLVHDKIARYGSLRAWARLLEHADAAGLLAESLHEEKESNALLTETAFAVNPQIVPVLSG